VEEPAARPRVPEGRRPDQAVLHVVGLGERPASGGPTWRPRGYWIPLALLLCGPAVLLLVLLEAPVEIRVGPVLVYLTVVPGLTTVRLLRLGDPLVEVVLGVGLSLALGVLVSQLMVYLGVWSPTLGLAALVTIGSTAAAAELYRGPLRRGPADHKDRP
jgi:hypothetical protein